MRNSESIKAWLPLGPALLALIVLFLWPITQLLWLSVSEPKFGLSNYVHQLNDGAAMRAIVRTIVVAFVISTTTLFLAYPYAYLMTRVGKRVRLMLLLAVLLPFWTSLMARTFAWMVILGRGGPVNNIADAMGVSNFVLLGSAAGAAVGMIQLLLPYMVLFLYSTMSSIDHRLVNVSKSLGASGFTTFRTIYFPLSMPGVVAGYCLVFIFSIGFYVTPKLLGSPGQALIAQIIGIKVNTLLDFGGAGALSAILLAITAALLFLSAQAVSVRRLLGEDDGA